MTDEEGKPLIIYENTNEESNGDSMDIANAANSEPILKSQKDFNSLKFGVPAFFYLVSCVLQLISLSKIQSSTFMLLRSSLMVFTGILSKFFTKKKLFMHHTFAMVIVAIGLTIVSILAAAYNQKDSIEADELEPAETGKAS